MNENTATTPRTSGWFVSGTTHRTRFLGGHMLTARKIGKGAYLGTATIDGVTIERTSGTLSGAQREIVAAVLNHLS